MPPTEAWIIDYLAMGFAQDVYSQLLVAFDWRENSGSVVHLLVVMPIYWTWDLNNFIHLFLVQLILEDISLSLK